MRNKLPNKFLASTVRRLTGLSQNLLTQWIDRGFIKASTPASGSGTRNKFNVHDIYKIELFKLLNQVGFTRSTASKIAFTNITWERDDPVYVLIGDVTISIKLNNLKKNVKAKLDQI